MKNKIYPHVLKGIAMLVLSLLVSACGTIRGTGDLGVVIERADGSVQIIETTGRTSLARVDGLGDLSHASVVFSRDERFAYVFGRDGGLTKIDVLQNRIVKRVIQSGNSIGGAISQDGSLIAVSNYKPGGVRIFNAQTLEMVADIPAKYKGSDQASKVVGLVDAPGQYFVFSLYDAGEIWVVNMQDINNPQIQKFRNIGRQPYDGLITPDGRYYITGLFGEDGVVLLDMWNLKSGPKRILNDYGRGNEKMPVYKMPHLEGWAVANNRVFMPGVGRNEVIVVNKDNWKQENRISVHGQPIFVMSRPDGRHIWVNFAFPRNDTIQVIDTISMNVIKTIKPGKAILHMEFTPRGENVWVSVRDNDQIKVFDTDSFEELQTLPALKPSGIFFTSRAHKTGL